MGAATTIVNAKVFDGTKSQDWTSVRFADGLITKCSAASAAQASAAEAEELDAFDAQLAKVVAAVRERWSS